MVAADLAASKALPCETAGSVTLVRAQSRGKRARPRPIDTLLQPKFGEWLSLVEHLVRDQGVGGSNPLSPTNKRKEILAISHTRNRFFVAASEGGANFRRTGTGRLLVSTDATLGHPAKRGIQALGARGLLPSPPCASLRSGFPPLPPGTPQTANCSFCFSH